MFVASLWAGSAAQVTTPCDHQMFLGRPTFPHLQPLCHDSFSAPVAPQPLPRGSRGGDTHMTQEWPVLWSTWPWWLRARGDRWGFLGWGLG